jgi:hypothetical protein
MENVKSPVLPIGFECGQHVQQAHTQLCSTVSVIPNEPLFSPGCSVIHSNYLSPVFWLLEIPQDVFQGSISCTSMRQVYNGARYLSMAIIVSNREGLE